METKKQAFKKFVIEQLKDFDEWREASPDGYAETIADEAVKLFCQPVVVGRSEQLFCPECKSDVVIKSFPSHNRCTCFDCKAEWAK